MRTLRAVNLEWQPAQTAPKDGTVILIYDGFDVTTAYWQEWSYLDWENVDENTKTKTKIVNKSEWKSRKYASPISLGDDFWWTHLGALGFKEMKSHRKALEPA